MENRTKITQKENELLLRDLCARLPYKIKINCFDVPRTLESISIDFERYVTLNCGGEHFYYPFSNILHKDCLPYLRPMESMTEGEANEFEKITEDLLEYGTSTEIWNTVINWLDANYFDHRGLIPKGLALSAPEGMYNEIKEE